MHGTKPITIFSIAMAAVIISSGCFSTVYCYTQTDAPAPFFGLVIHSETAKPFNIVASIMEIHPGYAPSIVVAERTILITEYEFENRVNQTRLIDKEGEIIKIQDLKEGQRVIIKGLELDDETIVAESIQVKPKRE